MRTTHWLSETGRWGLAAALAITLAMSATARAQDDDDVPPERDPPRRRGENRPRPPRNDDRPPRREEYGDRERPPREPRPPIREEMRERRRDEAEFWLGLMCVPMPEDARMPDGLPKGQGLIVRRVFPDSPADKAGLKQNDVVSTADGKPLKGTRDLMDVVRAAKDKEFEVELFRDGKSMTIAVMPGKRPEGPAERLARDLPDLDRLYELFDRDGKPLRFRFFHPGMLLPPGANPRAPFPDDLNVKITKQGNKPAEIEVSQGDKSWKVTENTLADLPEEVRGHVAGFIGRPLLGDKFSFQVLGPDEGPEGDRGTRPRPPGPPRGRRGADDGPAADEPRDAPGYSRLPHHYDAAPPEGAERETARRLGQRVDDLSRRLRELRDELERLGPRSGGPKLAPPDVDLGDEQ